MSLEWQSWGRMLTDVLELENEPVGVRCARNTFVDKSSKVRICKAILDASKGEKFYVSKENNACFGASWHLGFQKINNPKIKNMIKEFVVKGEKLFSSYEALDNMINNFDAVPCNKDMCFILEPLTKASNPPQVVIFVCNPYQACRLLTLVTFVDGIMPRIKIGGPTCRMIITYPLTKGEINISFYDYTARKMCNVGKDKLLVAVPYSKIPVIVESIDKCSAGRARIEYPEEFRKFLKNRFTQTKD